MAFLSLDSSKYLQNWHEEYFRPKQDVKMVHLKSRLDLRIPNCKTLKRVPSGNGKGKDTNWGCKHQHIKIRNIS